MRAALEGGAARSAHDVAEAELAFEFMLNALRLLEGFSVALFTRRTGLPITVVERQLGEAQAAGLIARDAFAIRPTDKGRRFLNDLLAIFLPERASARRTVAISISSPGTSRSS
jgi:oxygen-independent coproporphyrinogen-3 oxidase